MRSIKRAHALAVRWVLGAVTTEETFGRWAWVPLVERVYAC